MKKTTSCLRGLSLVAAVAAAPAARAATAPGDALVPTLSASVGKYDEALRADLEGATQSATRSLWASRLAVGVVYGLPVEAPSVGRVTGQTSLGWGVVYALGQWPLHLRQEAQYAYPVSTWLSLVGGLAAGVQINLSGLYRSHGELGLSLGVLVADAVEVIYAPRWTIALGSKEERVFAGVTTRSVENGLAPFELLVRGRFNGLGL